MSHGQILILGAGLIGALIGWFNGNGSGWKLFKGFIIGLGAAGMLCLGISGIRTMQTEHARQVEQEARADAERIEQERRALDEAEIDNDAYGNLVKWKGVDCTVDRMVAEALENDRISPGELEAIEQAETEYNRRSQKSELRGQKVEYCPREKKK